LEIQGNLLVVSAERCVRCALCAGVCPVGAIQVPEMSEDAYRELIRAIQGSTKRTLVITCDEDVPNNSEIHVQRVPAIGVMGVRQLAAAAGSSIGATIVYCPDGLCVGKEHVRQLVDLISSIMKASPPQVYYLEGREAAAEIERIHNSAKRCDSTFELAADPWQNYIKALEKISPEGGEASGLGITELEIAESCTLCNACVDRCPHKALAIEAGELLFNSRNCTGCGYCGQICPEHSVTLLAKQGPIEFLERTVYKDEMVKCSRCNTPYASAKMLRKVSAALETDGMTPICPACREKGIYEKLLGKISAKVMN
jgi:Fe-S-cluster-containing hydrogenase component 2